jgi:hypothetical protein
MSLTVRVPKKVPPPASISGCEMCPIIPKSFSNVKHALHRVHFISGPRLTSCPQSWIPSSRLKCTYEYVCTPCMVLKGSINQSIIKAGSLEDLGPENVIAPAARCPTKDNFIFDRSYRFSRSLSRFHNLSPLNITHALQLDSASSPIFYPHRVEQQLVRHGIGQP